MDVIGSGGGVVGGTYTANFSSDSVQAYYT